MKKIALLMALLMLVLSLTACGEKTNAPENTTGTVSETGETPDVPESTCEHQFQEELISEPGCEEAGLMLYTCVDCEMTYTENVPALGHDGSGASCTEASTCATCGQVVEDAWGHKDENGICKNCGISLANPEIPASTEAAQPTEATETTEATEATETAE